MTIGLAIIDVQKQFLPEDVLRSILHVNDSLQIINYAAATFRQAQQPVFRVYDAGAGSRDDMNYEFIDQVSRASSDIIIHKSVGNGFNGTELKDKVTELGIELLLLCGYRSEYCVHATAMGAYDLGIPYALIRDGHLSPDRQSFEAIEKLLPTMSSHILSQVVGAFAR